MDEDDKLFQMITAAELKKIKSALIELGTEVDTMRQQRDVLSAALEKIAANSSDQAARLEAKHALKQTGGGDA